MLRVNKNAFDRAHFNALRRIEMSDTFGATRRRDFINHFALSDRVIRARGRTNIAIHAQVVDKKGHDLGTAFIKAVQDRNTLSEQSGVCRLL